MNGLVIIDMNNFAIVFLFHSSLENGLQHGQQGAATISRRAHCEKSHPSYYCTQKNMEANRQCYVHGTKT
ncbi:BEM_collapsed_G0011460.mRNA.1.CDS.1 [Saccharomyces cerevisiae]|nr:BEM_HP_G0145850.mRNA.1.CDS.1 [Saccharomyces cerevisiae]CAI5103215.1 BEM_HP_G0063740.mRNA.1.CDS.1 [Saccharomyces cerevisiae]CAI5203465.1 BEM_HP_G0102230.mRNA.1.CDS.1 [Saccharomyces cerevisiae]CAI6622057.1 BEM_HP_G0145850.mRNA.1.CDS.1 [Saccharomyces cerevisiae]CAI6975077.1 BEM_HP_G0063740.mRNA.1.CDS.1 [Saccharomyces cerevisiae]